MAVMMCDDCDKLVDLDEDVEAWDDEQDCCWDCAEKRTLASFDTLPRIADVKLKCPECGLITTVGQAEPDIDGEGSLGCPRCLCATKKKIVMYELNP